ncbi:MAG: sulfatase-like hydrolase/transferase, partial [Rhodospirillaceae bacterium]|nr:sulfatase-like hydrolase/transferase [Rhodospirillaceae bacterium]
MADRPNFLFIVTDQQRADHLSCAGNPLLRTPHIDSIAARGTRFDRFYVAAPICMPNRATIMTGRMPSLHGVRMNGIPLGLDATCFTHLLKRAGYRTALM